MGCIFPYDEYDYLDYKCPKRREITELIVTNKIRSKGIGQELINKMEEYFKSVGCEYVIVDVFAYNEIGKKFYNKKDYHARMETMIKEIQRREVDNMKHEMKLNNGPFERIKNGTKTIELRLNDEKDNY